MDKSDTNFIDASLNEINQWSIKLDNGEIFMIQRPTKEDLFEARASYLEAINAPQPLSRTAEALVQKVENHTRVCPACGSEMIRKTGKSAKGPWAGWFCSKKCGANPIWE